MTCKACTQAASDWKCGWYRKECPDCMVRMLANSPKAQQQARLEQIQNKCGAEAHRVTAARIKAESARIATLKGQAWQK